MQCLGAKSPVGGLARWAIFSALTVTLQAASFEEFTNSIGMEFVRIPPMTFSMVPLGSAVTLSTPFYILKEKVSEEAFRQSGLSGSVDDISWNDAASFCAWLSRQDHRTYRLPTEAEWVCASQKLGAAGFQGQEWVNDWYGNIPFSTVRDPAGPLNGLTKVIRAGSNRLSLSPDAKSFPWGLPKTSFRIVLEPETPAAPSFTPPAFTQAAVKETLATALSGPEKKVPFFHVRFALPIPPENSAGGAIAGIDPSVMAHLHSPGFEILPNGDALAIFFSAKDSSGASECDTNTCFVQARLRYGAEEWDPPELFCDFKDLNDQSGLLWREGNTVRFFGGGRGEFPWMPFKMAVSTNSGATWTMSLPLLDAPAHDFTPQPIANAFRGNDGGIYFAMDGGGDESFLWRSLDNGVHWHDMGGRTAARHSTIVPVGEKGRLLSIGGKNASIDDWSPQNTSSDYGATWSPAAKSSFPALGGNQRPCMIRLGNGHLCLVTDSYHRKKESSPAGWAYGEGCVAAISRDDGKTWRIKRLPVELPHETDRKHGTLGYATVREGPNGVIHLLTTMTHPCLYYEFNEAWIFSDVAETAMDASGGRLENYAEKYPDAKPRITWRARICANGRYLLDGPEVSYYENGQKEHEAFYVGGRKTGEESFWDRDGCRIWTWTHRPEKNMSTWVQYWKNGNKRIESNWNTQPRARDLDRRFIGLIANGPTYHWKEDGTADGTYSFKDGNLTGPVPLSAAK